MTIAERELAMIGFGGGRPEPVVWAVAQLGAATHAGGGQPEPASSEALVYWRKLLARDRGRSLYRIRRIEN
jgi:hypothetical protein